LGVKASSIEELGESCVCIDESEGDKCEEETSVSIFILGAILCLIVEVEAIDSGDVGLE